MIPSARILNSCPTSAERYVCNTQIERERGIPTHKPIVHTRAQPPPAAFTTLPAPLQHARSRASSPVSHPCKQCGMKPLRGRRQIGPLVTSAASRITTCDDGVKDKHGSQTNSRHSLLLSLPISSNTGPFSPPSTSLC